jgi:hypothetical protein
VRTGFNRMPVGLGPDQLTPFSLTPVTIQADSRAQTAILAAYPLGQMVAQWSPGIDVKILSVSLATSMTNTTPDASMVIWVARYTGVNQQLGQTGLVYVEHIVNAGLAHSQRGGQDYVLETAPIVHHAESVAIYVSNSGTGYANNAWTGSATIRYTESIYE